MKKIFYTILFLLCFFPSYVFAMEKISNYQTLIQILPDAKINVLETIEYDFGNLQKHGIYRDIPISYKARGGNFNLRFNLIKILDENNVPINYQVSKKGGEVSIKIGNSDLFVSEKKTYKINYQIDRAINYFSEHDELYWNVVGFNWLVPIDRGEVQVQLPNALLADEVQLACFVGVLGSTTNCNGSEYIQDLAVFKAQNLAPGEGFTFVLGFPKGIVIEPTKWQKITATARDNWIMILPFIIFFLCLFIWNKFGKDPKPSIPIVAQYESPDKLTPAECGYLQHEYVRKNAITAELIQLAVTGYLKISRETKKSFWGFEKEDFRFTKLKNGSDLTNAFQKELFESLFSVSGNEVTLSGLNSVNFTPDVIGVKLVGEKLVKGGYFPQEPKKIRAFFMIPIIFLLIFSFFLTGGDYIKIISLIISALIALVFAFLMSKRTQLGADTKQKVEGLKLYMSVSEKDRLDFHNDPEKTPERFEKLLPFAIALGVSEQWSNKFEGLYNQNPSWYNDPSRTMFNAVLLNSSLNNFSNSFYSTYNQNQSRASGGGSGFGGGGFSGGGFGGGGGGSW